MCVIILPLQGGGGQVLPSLNIKPCRYVRACAHCRLHGPTALYVKGARRETIGSHEDSSTCSHSRRVYM